LELCCGGGFGLFWRDSTDGTKITSDDWLSLAFAWAAARSDHSTTTMTPAFCFVGRVALEMPPESVPVAKDVVGHPQLVLVSELDADRASELVDEDG
jgi:hypothetical protein